MISLESKIVVICGGTSTEREVSLKSGSAIFNGLKEYGYKNVELFDLRDNNLDQLLTISADLVVLTLHGKHGEDGAI